MIRQLVGFLALVAVQAVFAEVPGRSVDVPLGLAQKQTFVRGLIEDAATARRIQAGGNTEAQRLWAAASSSYSQALSLIGEGDFPGAEKKFNDSMAAAGKARRMVPDTEAIAAKLRADYERQQGNVEAMRKSCLSYMKRSAVPREGDVCVEAALARQMNEARLEAGEKRMDKALRALEMAEQIIRPALGKILGRTVAEYVQEAKSPQAEYNALQERNRSYQELLQVAIEELRPLEDARQTIDSLLEQNEAALDLAREYASLRDYQKAIAHLRAGTGYMRYALISAGIVMPDGSGEE